MSGQALGIGYVVIWLIAANAAYVWLEGWEGTDDVLRVLYAVGGALLWPALAIFAVFYVVTFPARWLRKAKP